MSFNAEKEVFFDRYCPDCRFFQKDGSEEPCNECLNHPSNIDSHKPVNWKGARNKRQEKHM